MNDAEFDLLCLSCSSMKELHTVFDSVQDDFDFYAFADRKKLSYTNWLSCQDVLFEYYCEKLALTP